MTCTLNPNPMGARIGMGARIETGSGKVFEIPPDDPEKLGYEKVHFRENAFEEFAGLYWKYTFHNDYFTPLYRQKHRYLSGLRNPDRTEQIFWQEAQDWQTGTCYNLSAIHVVWGPADPVARMSGLIFEYGGRKIRRQVGSMSLPGVTRQSLKLAEGEEITGVHVLRPVGTVRHEGFLFQGPPRRVIDYSSFFHIEFHTSLGQKAVFSRQMPRNEAGGEEQRAICLGICCPYLFTRDCRYDLTRTARPSDASIVAAEKEKYGEDGVSFTNHQLVGLGITVGDHTGSGSYATIDGIQTVVAGYDQWMRNK
ncbi:hypothetical protein B0H65DRAFT_570873 [Neurospora tetraspora]|uniref:Uncharacterized protein n=1 Tax=Neurospora tetraspora TaxID=94610 RepID=A0AAE0JH26_9PEZI|nr:hypothetical protein B0H65DRAFT_570873 [Neurospora tetraspora]